MTSLKTVFRDVWEVKQIHRNFEDDSAAREFYSDRENDELIEHLAIPEVRLRDQGDVFEDRLSVTHHIPLDLFLTRYAEHFDDRQWSVRGSNSAVEHAEDIGNEVEAQILKRTSFRYVD